MIEFSDLCAVSKRFSRHGVDEPVLDRGRGLHEIVAVAVAFDPLDGLAGVLRQYFVQLASGA